MRVHAHPRSPLVLHVALAVLAMAGCKPKQPEPRPQILVTPYGTPEVSGCIPEVEVPLRATVDAESVGLAAHFEVDGVVLWEGTLVRDLELTVPFATSQSSVTGTFVSGEARGGIVFPVNVRPAEPPTIVAFGLYDGASIAEAGDVPLLEEVSAWPGSVSVDPYGSLAALITDSHADLGSTFALEVRRCPTDGPCVPMEVEALENAWLVDLEPVAEARCLDPADRSRDRFELEVTGTCGTSTASVSARMVHDDCDGDGQPVATDCDDEQAALTGPGDIAADGVAAATIEEALAASEITVCGGTFSGGWVIDHDLVLRSTDGKAVIASRPDMPTIRIAAGAVTLESVIVEGGDGGAGGGAIDAADATSLVLRDAELRDGTGIDGGNLRGPTTGDLTLERVVMTGGSAERGGNAFISGGTLFEVDSTGGTATLDGGGLYAQGAFTLERGLFEANVAARGAGVFVDHAEAGIGGVSFVESHATDAGGAIAAELTAGQVLELYPVPGNPFQYVDFEVCTASEGGAVWVSGGTLDSNFTGVYEAAADVGGVFRTIGATWTDRSSVALAAEAELDGAFAAITGGTASIRFSDVLASGADRGGVFVDGGAVVGLDSVVLNATGCGVWIESGTVTSDAVSGITDPADVCGPAFESPYAFTCTQLGCQ
ncbi:MAG: hypothetical protein H6737_02965 [Alphaproteobacteria bacterium]|nr:hypothetical protein [Alphaproteobacteria bacterium]